MSRVFHIRSRYSGSPHVFLATLSYTGRPAPAYVASLAATLQLLVMEGIALDHYLVAGNCHVDDARNGALRDFLLTRCTHLFFVDDDVGWNAEDFVKLCLSGRDFTAGIYPKKTPDDSGDEYTAYFNPGTELQADPDGFLELQAAPTGFMCLKRNVIERMTAANAHRRFTGQHDESGEPYTIVFERTYEDGRRWSGDFAFCRAWRAMDGQIFADPEMKFVHEGAKEWCGSLGDNLRDQNEVFHPRLINAMAGLEAGEADAETFIKMEQGWQGKWPATSELLFSLYETLKHHHGPVLETGSGLTTLLLGRLADRNGFHVHTLEHDPDYLRKTRKALDAFGIRNVMLHHAPLLEWRVGEFWYDVRGCLPEQFTFVLCDGPQQRFGRSGLFELFGPKIEGASIIMDDAANPRELSALSEWASAKGRNVHVLGTARKFAVCPA